MLRQPPPLDKPLSVVCEGDVVRLLDDDTLVAEGRPVQFQLDVPPLPTWAEAETAVSRYPPAKPHPLPTCFGCGDARYEGDGLRIFSGFVENRDIVAATWLPHPSFADDNGFVKPEFIWTALDCPGGWSILNQVGFKPILLGKFATRLVQPVAVGERYMVMGWWVETDGRKHVAGTAVYTANGNLCAIGKATWIVLR